jgi:hypothetical protein
LSSQSIATIGSKVASAKNSKILISRILNQVEYLNDWDSAQGNFHQVQEHFEGPGGQMSPKFCGFEIVVEKLQPCPEVAHKFGQGEMTPFMVRQVSWQQYYFGATG